MHSDEAFCGTDPLDEENPLVHGKQTVAPSSAVLFIVSMGSDFTFPIVPLGHASHSAVPVLFVWYPTRHSSHMC